MAPGVAEQGPWLLALAPGAALAHSIQEGQQGGRWDLAPRLPGWKLQALDLPLRSTLPLEQGQDQHWCWGRGRWQGEARMGISSSLPPPPRPMPGGLNTYVYDSEEGTRPSSCVALSHSVHCHRVCDNRLHLHWTEVLWLGPKQASESASKISARAPATRHHRILLLPLSHP